MSEATRSGALPGPLPEGERLLWQGSPDWRALARRTFHGRSLAIYFAFLLSWVGYAWVQDGSSVRETMVALLWFGALACAGLGLIALFAWLTGRTTTYTITDRRVVLSYGIAMPMSLNLPFAKIAAAAMRLHGDGTADIPLTMAAGEKVAYLMLWPHARPWRMSQPEPSLRAVPDGAAIAGILARALAAASAQPVMPVAGQAQPVAARASVATAAAA